MIRNTLLASAVSGGAVIIALPAASQQAQQGTILSASISSSLEGNDNYALADKSPGDALLWTNTLRFGISSITPVDRLVGNVSGDLRVADLPQSGTQTDLDNGSVDLNYSRSIDDSDFSFNFLANDADVEFLDPLRYFNDDGSFDDTRGGGRRTLMRGGFALNINGDGPIRFGLSGRATDISYHDTDSGSGLVDREYQQLTAMVGFDVTETAEIYVEASGYNNDRGNGNQSESASLRVGTKADISPITTIDANIGYQQVDSDYASRSSTTREGVVGGLSVTHDLPNGNIYASANASNYAGGTKTDVMVGREFDTPTGSFSGEAGASVTDASDVSPVFQLDYVTAGPTSQFNIGLSQQLSVNDDLNDRLNLALDAAYTKAINPVSSFTLSALAGREQDLEDEFDDRSLTRLTLTAQYDQTITRDWAVSTGIRHQTRMEDDDGDSMSNAVFLTLTRSFSARR
ncbi:hypothetical protein [Mangrovicoccus ximenensis]|uniref:hypothetical protein n=1 Tax=Mangrovicoccus ximenensis TaxID=1911570 RepID=UPI000D3C9905|nr:hypothetical protein [Mangrovicoccus ximenensis]